MKEAVSQTGSAVFIINIQLKFIPLEGSEEFVDIYALWKKNRKNQILEHFLEEIR